MQHSNGSNPFLEPAEQHSDPLSSSEAYINPFSDDRPAQSPTSADVYADIITDKQANHIKAPSDAYVNPFTDAQPVANTPASDTYVNLFQDAHTATVESSADYANPFEETTLHSQGGTAVMLCVHA